MEFKKPTKGLQLKTNVRAGCGEDEPPPPPPADNGGNRLLNLRGHRLFGRR